MAAIDWDFAIAWLLAPGFGLLIALYLYRRSWHHFKQSDLPHLVYLSLGLLWGVGILFAHPRVRDLALFVPFEHLAPYLLAASPALLLLTTADLVRSNQPRWDWLLILPAILILFAVLHDDSLRPNLSSNLVLGARRFDREGLWRLILLAADMTSIFATFQMSVELYRRGRGLVYRNRLRYWFLALTLIAAGDLLAVLFSNSGLVFYVGGLTRLSGVTMTTAILIIPYLPTVNYLIRLFLNLLAMALITFGLFSTSILMALAFTPDNKEGAVLTGVALVSATVAVIYLPLQRQMRTAIDELVLGRQSSLSNVLAEYGRQISKQLDLEQLADTVMTLLSSALHLESGNKSGALVVAQVTDQGAVGLSPVARTGQSPLPNLLCSPDSPLAIYWRESSEPLSHFDIEVLPDFADVPNDEQVRLAQWEAELYVPLHTSDRLVGLLTLGPKESGVAFNVAEVRFLKSLTEQTIVALEQAQLLSDLKIANTQLTRLSDQLVQVNRRLYEADQLKSGFIGVITHELRSPFVPLALAFQIIERHGLENLTPEQHEQLQALEKGITELKQMVDHIIAFASLLSKQGELKMERLDLGPVVIETVEAIRPMAESRQVSLDARVWPGLRPVQGDRERLSEAIYHLTQNAIKFNRPGGWVRVRCQPDNGNIEIRVQDNGIGVPPDKLEYLWSAFTQMADPLRRGVEGLGLGLALVRYVAVAHGGEVWAETIEGEGSTFGFKVPAAYPNSGRHP